MLDSVVWRCVAEQADGMHVTRGWLPPEQWREAELGIAVTAGISSTKEDSSAVHWWQRGGGLLTLVNIKSALPPLPFDTLVTGMPHPGCFCGELKAPLNMFQEPRS